MSFTPNDNDRLFRESKEEGWFRFSSPFRFVLLLIFLVFLIALGWYFLSPTQNDYGKAHIPLIKVDETPHKIKAEDQSVPGIKHQDKLVYGRIREDKNVATVEHILPDPEQPLTQINQESVKMVEQYQPQDLDLESSEVTEQSLPKITSIEDLIDVE